MLEGIRVVEMAVWVAGPAVGGLMADWGADVVKIEPPRGDPMRQLFGAMAGLKVAENPPFDLDNRGKRSVVLDVTRPEGAEAARRLIADADVFVSNLRPDALERSGFDWESLRALNPRLIYTSVTGYGLGGPDRDRAAYDVGAFWARGGGAALMVPEGAEPQGIRGGFGDHVTGMTALAGVLGALLQRERTGRGQRVATSLLRTGMYCKGWDLGIRLRFGKVAPTPPRSEALNPVLNSYRSGDGRWFWLLGLEADRHWSKLANLIGGELASDERFADARGRRKNAAELIARLDASFASADRDTWGERFDAVDLWWAPVQSPDEVIADPQARAAGAFVDVPADGADGANGKHFEAIATPLDFSDAQVGPSGPVPALGQHTESVLREAGYDDAAIADLRARGVLGTTPG